MGAYFADGRVWAAGRIAVLLLAACAMTACGGGGGGGSTSPVPPETNPGPPKITASVATYEASNIPAPLLAKGGNSLVVVSVTDASQVAPVGTAVVTVNGSTLVYVSELKVYRGWLVASTGDSVTIAVSLKGATYEVSGDLVPSHPQILSPPPRDNFPTDGFVFAELLTTREAWVTWSGDLPDARFRYAVAVLDERGELVWPSAAGFHLVPDSQDKSLAIPADRIPPYFPYISTGISRSYDIAGAAPGSTLTLGGFTMSMVYAVPSQTSVLSTIELRPKPVSLARGRTSQLTARGVRVDSSERRSLEDITGQVLWTSDNPAVVAVSARGVVTGGDAGSANITARLGEVSASTVVRVLAPAPAPAAGTASTYQMNAAHNGSRSFGGVSLPGAAAWSVSFPGLLSFPLIAEGRVFVLSGEGGETNGLQASMMFAHDASTGARLWGPVELSRVTRWAGFTHDQGLVVTVMSDCRLRAYDAANGVLMWSTNLATEVANVSSCHSAPTAYRGIAYVVGAGVDAKVMAVEVASGRLLWATRGNGTSETSPAVSDDGVYVAFRRQAYKFDPYTGALRWHYSGPGSGGGGSTVSLGAGRMYMRDPFNVDTLVFDVETGIIAVGLESTTIPALADGRAFTLRQGRLSAVDTAASSTLWSTTGDGGLVTAPVVVDDVVFVGSASGLVFGFSASNGQPVWQAVAGTRISAPDEGNAAVPLAGLAAGDGLLLVPAENVLTAFRLANP